MKLTKINFIVLFILSAALFSCRDVAVPKPKGHFRIALPEKKYIGFGDQQGYKKGMPLSFEYPEYGKLSFQNEKGEETGWLNIEFPAYKAIIYLTYKDVNNDFESLMEQTYKMNVKNHITKADAIDEKQFNNIENKVYGVLYDLKGNTASAVQFYATDSTKHYLRGSLYFAAEPNADSLAPVIDFFREDIVHLIETIKWK
ncbi:MAG TPA: gliding motility lipoprotein GldD [Bacteroidales bacterium]|nr:gliding motility lipoprotein GldD [Bacteroidales bacterium]HPT21665.1 gliding motility lipoprotein GldD [Bacteroidales bacterium]